MRDKRDKRHIRCSLQHGSITFNVPFNVPPPFLLAKLLFSPVPGYAVWYDDCEEMNICIRSMGHWVEIVVTVWIMHDCSSTCSDLKCYPLLYRPVMVCCMANKLFQSLTGFLFGRKWKGLATTFDWSWVFFGLLRFPLRVISVWNGAEDFAKPDLTRSWDYTAGRRRINKVFGGKCQ